MNPLAVLLAAIGADAATLAELQPLGQSILGLYESLANANAGAGLNLRFYRAAAELFPNLGQSAIVSAYRYVGYLQDPGIILDQIPAGQAIPSLLYRELPAPSKGLPTGVNMRIGVEVTVQYPDGKPPKTFGTWYYGQSGQSLDEAVEEATNEMFDRFADDSDPRVDKGGGTAATWTAIATDAVVFM